MYDLIEACSPGPYLELFARFQRPGWTQWGDEVVEDLEPKLQRRDESQQLHLDL